MQAGILEPVPALARHLFFNLKAGAAAGRIQTALRALAAHADGRCVVVGFGPPVLAALGKTIPGLRTAPALRTAPRDAPDAAIDIPSTPAALWCWVRGSMHVSMHDKGAADSVPGDAGDLLHSGRHIGQLLAPAFALDGALDVFRHGSGRDLTGYEDGTENPQNDAAAAAAITQGLGAGLDGASFAAFQQWQHDFAAFDAMPSSAQDDAIGRRKSDNQELDGAPASAHVKRTAQESFMPEAFVLRRSMPWIEGRRAGLAFLAFGKTLDAFEAQLRRMAGLDDGIADALFGFSRPVSGAYFWCPPLRDGKLDLRRLGQD